MNTQNGSKAIILSLPRSGTQLLKEALDNHSEIRCEGEILLPYFIGENKKHTPKTWNQIATWIDKFFVYQEENSFNQRVYIFKCMYQHLDGLHGVNYKMWGGYPPSNLNGWGWKWLKDQNIKVIHLVRDNYVRRGVSEVINSMKKQTGRKAHSRQLETPIKLHIDVDRLDYCYLYAKKNVEIMRKYLTDKEINHIEIKYSDVVGEEGEDICVVKYKISQRICNFLGVSGEYLKTSTRRQNPRDLKEYVSNYKKIKSIYGKEAI